MSESQYKCEKHGQTAKFVCQECKTDHKEVYLCQECTEEPPHEDHTLKRFKQPQIDQSDVFWKQFSNEYYKFHFGQSKNVFKIFEYVKNQ